MKAALALPKEGRVYDLGVLYDRSLFERPDDSPAEVIAFRTPEGVKRQKDLGFMERDEGPLALGRGLHYRQPPAIDR